MKTMHQLLVSQPRRNQLLELTHSSFSGSHLREKKTTQRFKNIFLSIIKNYMS